MLAKAVKVVVVLKMDDDLAAAANRGLDLDLCTQRMAKLLLEGRDLVAGGSLAAARTGQNVSRLSRFLFLADLLADHPLDVPDAEAVLYDAFGQRELLLLVAQGQKGPGVSRRDRALTKSIENRAGQLEQPHQVGDRRAIDLQPPRQVLLRAVVLVEIALEREGLLDRVKVFSLQILNDGQFRDEPVVGLANAGGDRGPASVFGSPQPPFAGNELIAPVHAADEHRLQEVVLLQALGQRDDLGIAEIAPRLEGVLLDLGQRQMQQAAGLAAGRWLIRKDRR